MYIDPTKVHNLHLLSEKPWDEKSRGSVVGLSTQWLPLANARQILLQNKFLEQQQVAEMAMLPPGDARTRLYRLLRDRCRTF